MATLIFIWDAPGSKLATWPTATFAVYIAIHGHALRHGPPELYSYTALYIIQLYIAIHYTTSTTPLACAGSAGAAYKSGEAERAREWPGGSAEGRSYADPRGSARGNSRCLSSLKPLTGPLRPFAFRQRYQPPHQKDPSCTS
jgi:hypothetical protein